MVSGLLRMSACFLVVVLAYWAYALLAVPWIEPPTPQPRTDRDLPGETAVSPTRRIDLTEYFPPDAWEMEAKTLETDHGVLIFKDYQLHEDRTELKPVTLLYFTEAGNRAATGAPHDDRPIILRAPQGAVLLSDGAMNPTQAQFSTPIGGRLLGEIEIQRAARPGADDQLTVRTRNVRIDRNRIWTTERVEFRWGKSFGSGKDLEIQLDPAAGKTDPKAERPAIKAIKTLELVRVERLLIPMQDAVLSPGQDPGKTPPSAPKQPPAPLEVTCDGPFRFDFRRNIATFEEQVQVQRLSAGGPRDELRCQRLEIHFELRGRQRDTPVAADHDRDKPRRASSQKTRASTVQPLRIIAQGSPAQWKSPSTETAAEGDQLEYDFSRRRFILQGDQPVRFRFKQHELKSDRLEYELHPTSTRRLGRLWASGPGQLRGSVGQKKEQAYEAHWEDILQVQPQEDHHVISLYDDARVRFEQFGYLAANEIHLYTLEVPASSEVDSAGQPTYTLAPDRMLARGNVNIDSASLSGTTHQINVWLRRAPQSAEAGENPAGGNPAARPPAAVNAVGQNQKQRPPSEKYHVQGDLVQIQVLLDESQKPLLDDVTVTGNVHVRQVRGAGGDIPFLVVDGDLLQVSAVSSDRAVLQVAGKPLQISPQGAILTQAAPARVSARGLMMQGAKILLQQDANRLTIPGPGTMTIPSRRPAEDSGPTRAHAVTIDWKGSMEFDGRTARFRKDLQLRGTQQTAKGELMKFFAMGQSLDVTLTDKISFRQPERRQQGPEVGLKDLQFKDDVYFENRMFQPETVQQSLDRMQVRDLNFDQLSGALSASGPGWASTVRPESFAQRLRNPPLAGPNAAAPSSGLTYIRVAFQAGLQGNVQDREIHFLQQVRTVYGPVGDWNDRLDADQPDGLGKDGAELTCDRLTISEMSWMQKPSTELEAFGNARVRGRSYTARAHRFTYSEGKDLLILHSDGNNQAVLELQDRVAAPPRTLRAGKIHFWPQSRNFELHGVGHVELGPVGKRGSSSRPR